MALRKKVQKDKISGQMLDVVSKYATDKNKNGTEAKSFTITDMAGLLNECESVIKSLHLPDLDLKCKIQNQIELMGYIDLTTNKKEDRRKLLITDVFPLSSKKRQHGLGLCGTNQIDWERQGVQTHHQVFRVRKNTSQTIRHNLCKGIGKE